MPKRKKDESRLIDPTSIPRADTDKFLDKLSADLGGEGVMLQRAQDMEGRLDLRRPCGIPSLDMACGGGLPVGGLSQIDGPQSVGKNLLLNHYFAENQRLHGENSNIFMMSLEYNYDKAFARACGVKVAFSPYEIRAQGRRFHQLGIELTEEEEEGLLEQTGKFHLFRGAASERLLEGVVEAVHLNAYQVGGIDSWDAMLTAADADKDLEENAKVADPANIQTRWMRKVQGALTARPICPECFSRPLDHKNIKGRGTWYCPNKKDCGWSGPNPYPWENETTLIGIRQVRANLNRGTWGREYKVGGAWALKHGVLIDIQLRPGKSIKDKAGDKLAKEITWEIMKGKAGTHEGKKGTYTYYYTPPEVDVASDIVNYCIDKEIFVYEGKRWKLQHNGLLPGEDPMLFGSREAVQRAVEDGKEVQEALKLLMLQRAELGHIRYK